MFSVPGTDDHLLGRLGHECLKQPHEGLPGIPIQDPGLGEVGVALYPTEVGGAVLVQHARGRGGDDLVQHLGQGAKHPLHMDQGGVALARMNGRSALGKQGHRTGRGQLLGRLEIGRLNGIPVLLVHDASDRAAMDFLEGHHRG